MELKAPEVFFGALIVYLLMKPRPEEQIPAEEEEEAALVTAEPEGSKVVSTPIPPGFLRGLEADPMGPASAPSMSKALRRKLARITDP